jgi:hypothetical protein
MQGRAERERDSAKPPAMAAASKKWSIVICQLERELNDFHVDRVKGFQKDRFGKSYKRGEPARCPTLIEGERDEPTHSPYRGPRNSFLFISWNSCSPTKACEEAIYV